MKSAILKPSLILTLLFWCVSVCADTPWRASWIWSREPAGRAFFRRQILLPAQPVSAKVAITADDSYTLYLNGEKIGSGDVWKHIKTYSIQMRKGANTVAIEAADAGGGIGAVLLEAAAVLPGGKVLTFESGPDWRTSTTHQDGWMQTGFDDSSWSATRSLGKPPVDPWGGIDPPDLYPHFEIETLSVNWPAGARPGQIVTISCRARLVTPASIDTPVALTLSRNGEIVCRHWMRPQSPITRWKPGEVQELSFERIRLPSYLPEGIFTAALTATASTTAGGVSVTVGRTLPAAATRAVSITNLKVSFSGRTAKVSAATGGARAGQRYLFALIRGSVMWHCHESTSLPFEAPLPADLPAGDYQAVLLPHLADSAPGAVAALRLPEPEARPASRAIGYGVYRDRSGIPHRWYVNRAGALIWDGEPYIPAGAMFLSKFFMGYRPGADANNEANFKDDLERLTLMKKAGITDLYLNPCEPWHTRPAWVWMRFADLCEQMGMRYGIQVTNELAPFYYFDISADEHTVTAAPGEQAVIYLTDDLNRAVPEGPLVLFAAYDPSTGALLKAGKAVVARSASGVRAEAALPERAGPVTVHFTPVYQYTGGFHDYWTSVDVSYKTKLNRFFSSLSFGPGLRAWLDPLDNEQSLQDLSVRRLPRSPGFQRMFSSHLRLQYGSVTKAAEAWGLTGDRPATFDELSRLVPAAYPAPNALLLMDPVSERIYTAEASRSSFKTDVFAFRDRSGGDFNVLVADLIKKHHDVPVVLKHEGTELYTNPLNRGGFDGLGAEAYGADRQHLVDLSVSIHDQSARCGRTMWQLTTETGRATPDVGYPSPLDMLMDYTAMVEAGGKGTYNFLIKDAPRADPNADWYTFNLMSDPRQIYWLGTYSQLVKQSSLLPSYQPETSRGSNFLKDVLDAEVLDLGPAFQAIRFGNQAHVYGISEIDLPLSADGARRMVKSGAAEPLLVVDASSISGSDRANSIAADSLWNRAVSRASALSLPAPDKPGSWPDVRSVAEALLERLGDAAAVPTSEVKLDGDLSEWTGQQPLIFKANHEVNDSRYPGARIYTGYDAANLYIAGSIDDAAITNPNGISKLWDGDAVEVFIDLAPLSDRTRPSLDGSCYQFIFSPTSNSGEPAVALIRPGAPAPVSPASTRLAVKRTESGWNFEAAIAASDLGGTKLVPGALIGLELQLDQSDSGPRSAFRLWHGLADAFQNRLGYGRLVLAGPKL